MFIALSTSGNQGSNVIEGRDKIGAVREAEQLEAAKLYDAEVRFLRYDDEFLLDGVRTRRDFINAMRWADPDVIFTHYPQDPSTDHAITGQLVTWLMQSLPGKNIPADVPPVAKKPTLFYWDTTAGVGFLPEAYVDITDTMDLKLQAVGKHKSQQEWMGNFMSDALGELAEVSSRFRGLQVGCKHAEAFRACRIHGFMPNFKLLP